jgi:hypothetical protein
LPLRAAHDSEKQHGGVTGLSQTSSSNSSQSHREKTSHRPHAGQVRRTPSARSPLKSPSPALRRQSFSMSSFSPPPVAPVPTNTSERTRTPRGKASSDLRVATGGGVLPKEEANGNNAKTPNNVSPFLDHTSEPDSGYNSSSQAPQPVDRDNSRFTRNEETGDNPKGSIEKTNTVGQRRNAALDDEGNGSRPGTPGYDAYWAQHRQTRSVSRRDHTLCTAPSPNIFPTKTSVNEDNLTIPVTEMILAHHMLPTPMKVEKKPTKISRRYPKPSHHRLVAQSVVNTRPLFHRPHPHLHQTGILEHFRAAICRRRAGRPDRVVRIP